MNSVIAALAQPESQPYPYMSSICCVRLNSEVHVLEKCEAVLKMKFWRRDAGILPTFVRGRPAVGEAPRRVGERDDQTFSTFSAS